MAWKLKHREIFSPEQKGLTGDRGIPVVEHEIHDGTYGYRRMMLRRWRRAKKIACAQIGQYEVPVTPLPNPRTGNSYHIIRLTNKWKRRYRVDLLVKDNDAYLVAFRRQYLNDAGEWIGETWYRYSDVKDLPKEIEAKAKVLDFDSSHGDRNKTTPGGIYVLVDIFDKLSTFEDCARDHRKRLVNEEDGDAVQEALLKAIVTFSEAFRFRSIYLMMIGRIRERQGSSAIDDTLWNLIHNWGTASKVLQALWKSGLPMMHEKAPEFFRGVKVNRPGSNLTELSTMEHVIGAQGEMLLLNIVVDNIVTQEKRLELEKKLMKSTARVIPEPGFD